MTSAAAPRSDASLTQRGDLPTREYAGFFRDLATAFNLAANLPQDIQALTVRVDALEEEAGAQIGNIVGDSSIVTDGVLQGGVVTVHLLNDVDIAPALSFYGAITEGVKGWQTFSGNFAALDNGDSTYSLDLSDLANSGVGTALVKITRDGKGRISGTEAATTTDLAEGSNLYFTDARADARITTAKADPNGVASLVGGKLDAGQLPALAITETFVVASQAAMLALTCQQGDVAVRTDLNKSLILTASPPSTLANWQELLAPTGTVASFNGRTGSVVPASGDYTAAQVGLGNVDNTSDANKPVSTAQQTAMDALSFKNRLINGDFAINQRAFAGGSLAAGVYGFDRWKAGTGGCNVSLSGGVLTHTSGPLVQVMEAPGLAGVTVTVSVEDPSGSVSVDVDGVTGTITSGAGRRGVSIAVPSGSTGNVTLTLTATGVTYKRVQLEVGATATAFDARHPAIVLQLCQRYYQVISTTSGSAFILAAVYTSIRAIGFLYLPVSMRATPAGSSTGALAFVSGGGSGGAPTLSAVNNQIIAVIVPITTVSIGTAGYFAATGGSQSIKLDAEL